ncbi:MAG: hypothetical protein BWY77_00190 [bacterium ADurb.Bin431]|nr:MAG: hypothetical protein BWY77_00190 [bacterium ADurb.Bin431]
MQGVLNAGLFLLHLDLGGSADLEDRNTAGQLGQTLLQLLLVIIGSRGLDLLLDLGDASLDVLSLAGALDDGGVVLVDGNALGLAEIAHGGVLEFEAGLFGDDTAAGEDGDVFEHGLAAIAETGGLDCGDAQGAAQLVDHQGGEGLALDILGDDQHRTAGLGHLLEDRQQILHGADLLVIDENHHLFEDRFHGVGIGDEIGRDITAIELHALDNLKGGIGALGLFDGDDAVLAHLFHSIRDQFADRLVVVGGNGADLGDLGLAGNRLALLAQLFDDALDALLDAALQGHRIGAGGDVFQTFTHDRLGKHSRRGGAVTGHVAGLGGHFAHHLGAHVLQGIFQLNLFGHRHAVLGHGRGAELFVDHDIAALGAESRTDRFGQLVHADLHRIARIYIEFNNFCHMGKTS